MRTFDQDTVQNGHIYSSIKEEEIFKYCVNFDVFWGLGLVMDEMSLRFETVRELVVCK